MKTNGHNRKSSKAPAFVLRAERALGAAKKATNAYAVVLGTGISGAWFFGHKIYTGEHDCANGLGYTLIDFKTKITAIKPKISGKYCVKLLGKLSLKTKKNIPNP